ncbi:MAG: dephospho-CoA kinase, partial [Acidimicrobiales bacterium]
DPASAASPPERRGAGPPASEVSFGSVCPVIVIGLTGGIGAGKSTVATQLASRGAVIVDADRIARDVVEPGGAAFRAIVDHFGPEVLGGDGRLDRPALAAVVFRDAEARAALEAITHPAIQAEMARQVAAHPDAPVVVMDIPLLKTRREPMAGVLVVDVPEELAVRRLVDQRGFDEGDARRRIAAQITREERRSIADVVVDNSGDQAQLAAEIDRVWAWIEGLAPAG